MVHQFCLVSYTECYDEFTDPEIKIDSLTNFLDIVNFIYFPCNLMTKLGMKVVDCHFSVKKLGLMIEIIFERILSKFTYFPYLHNTF